MDNGIVKDNSIVRFQTDLAGNIVLSKDPAGSSILKPTSQMDKGGSSFQCYMVFDMLVNEHEEMGSSLADEDPTN